MFGLPEILAVGGILFWIFIAIASCFMIASVEYERPGSALFVLIIAAVLFGLFGNYNVLAWIATNPMTFIYSLLAYFGIGMLWAIARWWFFILRATDAYASMRSDYLTRTRKSDLLTDSEKAEFKNHVNHTWSYGKYKAFPIKVSDHKNRILIWLGYWPFSAVWTLLNDPVKYLGLAIYARINGVLQAISDKMFKKFNELD